MTLLLIQSGAAHTVLADAPVVKAADVRPIEQGLTLLREAERVLGEARAEGERLRTTSEADGRARGFEQASARVAEALTALAGDVAEQQQRRDEELATAALAAVEAIIGAGGVAAIGPALVQQALDSFVGDDAVTVEVAPALAAQLSETLRDAPQVTIVANDALAPLDCELRTGRGTIRAGLTVQLAALAERWGLKA